MSLPKVSTSAVEEIAAAENTIASLKNYQSKNWAIGLNGDTFKPDTFLNFFTNRDLPFHYYVQNKGVSIGSSQAYSQNINALSSYIQSIIDSEVLAVKKVIKDLQSYKQKFWAIGLNGDTLQPDGFNNFFAARNIEFYPFVRSKGVSIGEESAYDNNISALEKYISELEKHSTAVTA